MNPNVHIYCYQDIDLLRGAITSIHDVLGDVDIHVCDGRYEFFGSDTDPVFSPDIHAYCQQYSNVTYHAPPDELLPFGHDLDVPADWRPCNHQKAKWVFDEVLPPDEWTLKFDTDERLRKFAISESVLDPKTRYAPVIKRRNDHNVHVARLWKPKHWTPWINDCLMTRGLFPRDHPLEHRARFWNMDEYRAFRFYGLRETRDIVIDNRGDLRPDDWRLNRVEHLERIGRTERAETIREHEV